jgi:hypothetical protein
LFICVHSPDAKKSDKTSIETIARSLLLLLALHLSFNEVKLLPMYKISGFLQDVVQGTRIKWQI